MPLDRYRGQVIVIAPKAILRYTYQQQIQHEDLKCLEDRIEIAGYYHIVNRGIEQRNVFLEADDYEYLEELLCF